MNRKTILMLIAAIILIGYATFFIKLNINDDHFAATFWVFYIQAWSFVFGVKYAKKEKKREKKT